jgi:murein DD-endopeptidase MepM/ murein hydrolase activator NlpD
MWFDLTQDRKPHSARCHIEAHIWKESLMKSASPVSSNKVRTGWIFAIVLFLIAAVVKSEAPSAQEPSPTPAVTAPQTQKPPAEIQQLQIQAKGTPRQGSVLFLSVPGTKADQTGECAWRSTTRPLTWQGGSLGIIIPVALDAKPGGYTAKITVKNRDGSVAGRAEKKIDVAAHTYGTQQLWLSQAQLNRYDDPQSDRDNEAIHKALSFYTPGITWTSQFIWPINSYISTQFGLKRFYNNDPEPEFHRGFDLPGTTGTPVKASQKGIVRFAREKLVLHGTAVVIDHGRGIGTLYIHMNSLKVKAGDRVEQGQVIGTVGSTGVATGPHLHWAAYCFDVPIDPRLLFRLPAECLEK